jgi:AbrB family looped-hinge helix DNA binding protein
MSGVARTKMSSRGQVVVPEGIRRRLGLKAGSQFVVVGEKDSVILKAISPPTPADFDELMPEAREQARQDGMKRSDLAAAIREARGPK